jgi:ubiquinone/menaquinone biosynthesis C-methylase UbiE
MTKKDSTRFYYKRNAQEYFLSTYKLELQPLWRKLECRLKLGSLLLDLGSGSGRDLQHFSSNGHHVVGLDYSLELLKLAKVYTGLSVVCADFSNLPFGDDTFDAIWALGTLLHVTHHDLPTVLSELHRVMKTNAVLFTAMKVGTGEEFDTLGRYNVYYSPKEWNGILEKNKFDTLETEVVTEYREIPLGDHHQIEWIVSIFEST